MCLHRVCFMYWLEPAIDDLSIDHALDMPDSAQLETRHLMCETYAHRPGLAVEMGEQQGGPEGIPPPGHVLNLHHRQWSHTLHALPVRHGHNPTAPGYDHNLCSQVVELAEAGCLELVVGHVVVEEA